MPHRITKIIGLLKHLGIFIIFKNCWGDFRAVLGLPGPRGVAVAGRASSRSTSFLISIRNPGSDKAFRGHLSSRKQQTSEY